MITEWYKNLLPSQKLVTIEEIIKYKPKKINIGDSDEQALEKAIELSKKEYDKTVSMLSNKNGEYAGNNLNGIYSDRFEDINGMDVPFFQNCYDGI